MTKQEYMRMYNLVGAAMEVYDQLGRGMEEPIYQEAMQWELTERKIPFEREKPLYTYYKGRRMEKTYFADFMSEGIIVEFKSVDKVIADHRAQLFNYMRITKLPYGILANYGEDHFHAERYVYDPNLDRYVLLTKDNLNLYVKE